jgi:VWFA-related protein
VIFVSLMNPPAICISQVSLRSDLVLVPVTVRDKQGRCVTDLHAEDFKLLDNGQPQRIVFFSSEEVSEQLARPLELVILLDSSRSIAAILHQQRAAVTSLLNQLGEKTFVSLISFSQRPDVMLDFTNQKDQALSAFLKHQHVGGDTAIFDAVSFGLKKLSERSQHETRKIIIIISDGQDTASSIGFRECLQQADGHGITVYSILIPIYSPYGDRLVARRPVKGFRELAEETGGKFFQVGTVEAALNPSATIDLGPVFAAIVEDVRHQYYLGFYPPENSQPGFHRVDVRVSNKKVKVELRRRGYTTRPSS